MLFNSYEFIFLFLPIVLSVFFIIGARSHHRSAMAWLIVASLFFYAWWNPAYLGLMIASILINYGIGVNLNNQSTQRVQRQRLLFFGIALNITLLVYFKYTSFFVNNVNNIFYFDWRIEPIILPLGISFFTFTQIAFLVDTYRGKAKEANFLHYVLFVTYFPHLIAGPVLHHKDIMPQFAKNSIYKFCPQSCSVGLMIFAIGLFKKVVIADFYAEDANLVFRAAESVGNVGFFQSWSGALSYTFQLYFDFSGYSDMAIGASRLFGICLPLNFYSPYKAANIIEFWRRWHITLSAFLRDYLYFSLGGNRLGNRRRYFNLMLTMLLGGLWHGAGWGFIVWGGLHGSYLIINHLWISLKSRYLINNKNNSIIGNWPGRFITFLVVVIAWVFFRAETLSGAISMTNIMLSPSINLMKTGYWLVLSGQGIGQSIYLLLALFIVWFLPNTQEILAQYQPFDSSHEINRKYWWHWQPNMRWSAAWAIIMIVCILHLSRVSEFLYFQF